MSNRPRRVGIVISLVTCVSFWGCGGDHPDRDDAAVSEGGKGGSAGGASNTGGTSAGAKGGAPMTAPASTISGGEGGAMATSGSMGGNATGSGGGSGGSTVLPSSPSGGQTSLGSESMAQGGLTSTSSASAGGAAALGGTGALGGSAAVGGSPSAGGSSAGGGTTSTATNTTTGGVTTIGGAASVGGSSASTSTACVLPRGSALQFDNGTQPQYVSVPDAPALHFANAITVEAWVRPLTIHRNVIVAKPHGSGTQDSWALWFDYNKLYWGEMTPATAAAWPSAVGIWHHVAVSVERGVQTTQRVYVDGALVQVTNVESAPSYDWHPMLIGADIESGAFAFGFKGTIDEVRLYASMRTATQVVADMHAECATLSDPSLVAYYSFNEGSGTVAQDASPNHLHGTLGNLAVGSSASPTWIASNAPF